MTPGHRLPAAHIALSEVLTATEEYDEAVRVLRRAKESFGENGEINEALHKAEIALKQSKEVNYYKVGRSADRWCVGCEWNGSVYVGDSKIRQTASRFNQHRI